MNRRVLAGGGTELTVEGVGTGHALVQHAAGRVHVDGVVELLPRVGVDNRNGPVLPAVLYAFEQEGAHVGSGALRGQELGIDDDELVAQFEDVLGPNVAVDLACVFQLM